jgi:hypothetical protein
MKKIKAIDLTIGTVQYNNREKGLWIKISPTGLIYISWPTGRIYFKVSDAAIKNLVFDDDTRTISFTWEGPWENFASGQTKHKIKPFSIRFDKDSDYQLSVLSLLL